MTRHRVAQPSSVNLHTLRMWSKFQFDKLEEAGGILAFMVPCWILMVAFVVALIWLM
jgi:hypothetical protein